MFSEKLHKYSKILISVICLITVLCGIINVYAVNETLPPAFSEPVTEQKTVKIGYFDNYGMSFNDKTKRYYGYTYDYFDEIAKICNWNCEFISCKSWKAGTEMLKNGEIDIFGPMQKTMEREQLYSFTEVSCGSEYGALYTLEQNNIFYDDFEFFNGMRVGIEFNSPYVEMMDEFCSKYNLSVTYVTTDGVNIANDIQTGLYDAFLSGSLLDIPNTKVVEKIGLLPFYYAVNKENRQILEELNSALKYIQYTDIDFGADLFGKYYGSKSISTPNFTKEESEILKRYPEISVGFVCDIPPLNYLDKDNKFTGMSIDILNRLGEECGIKFNYYLSSENPDTDLVVFSESSTYSGNPSYTEPYLSGPIVLIYKNTNNIDENNRLAISRLTFTDTTLVASKYSDFEIIQYNSTEEAIKALQRNEADVALTSLYIFDCLIKEERNNNYIAVPTDLSFDLRIRITENMPQEIVPILNKGLNRIPASDIDTITSSALTRYTAKGSAKRFISANIIPILATATIIVSVFLLLILIIFFITFSKKRALKNIAYYDQITGLPSILKFKKDIYETIRNAAPNEYMIVSMDIDKFTYINNLLGYETGNKILKAIAKHIIAIASKDTYIAREMSDIFIFFLKTKNITQTNILPKDLVKRISPYLGNDYPLTFSIGIYIINNPSDDISTMIDKANRARKSSKHLYTNSFSIYTNDMEAELLRRRHIHLNMSIALENEEFIPYLQAKTDLITHEVRGAEILVKWHTATGEILQPATFIPIFEANGFVQKLDLYMFERACRIIKHWEDLNLKTVPRLSVNLSKKTVLWDGLCDLLLSCVAKYKINIKHIELELTESAFSEDMQKTIDVINRLKSVGFIISLDDFGSGYSSFNMLKNIYVDIIKIDKEFLEHSLSNSRGSEIIHSIIELSKTLNIETVAEGVETREQVELLKNFGCDLAQGFYFSRPTDLKTFDNTFFNIKNTTND